MLCSPDLTCRARFDCARRDPRVMDELAKAQGRWRRKLNGEAFPVMERWLKRAAR